jgi:HAD superfamily hydrolase (TIGR01450 family)
MPGWPTGHQELPPAITVPAARFPNDPQRPSSWYLQAGHGRWPVSAVAVVGLGAMGSRVAARLLDAGHEVTVWNRSHGRLSQLVNRGASAAATPAEAALRAEVLITMLGDPSALRSVAEGWLGIAAGARPPLTVVEMSTVGPAAVARLASVLPAGTGLLDAPVLGSRAEAESGSLVIFMGGPAELAERITPLLTVLGSVIHTGPLGSGAAAKLVANAAVFGTVGMLGETISLAQALGMPPDTAYRVLAATPLAAQAARRRPAIEAGEYAPRFALSLARKDARLINEAAAAAGADLRLMAAVETWLADAERAGLGDRDYTAMLQAIVHGGLDGGQQPGPGARRVPARTSTGYDGLIIDLDGVIWLGGDPIPGVADAVTALRADGTRVLFLTNEPLRSRGAIAARLTEIGIPATPGDVMTSVSAVARAVGSLVGLRTRCALVVGPPALRDEISGAGFQLLGCEDAAQAEVVVVGGHDGFDYRELRAATAAVRHGARLFATGRDPVFPGPGGGPEPGTGAIVAAVETAGGMPAIVAGKPERIAFEIAREALAGCQRIAVIGDNLTSDIAGAKHAGLDAILVLTGMSSRADLERAVVQPDLVLDSLAAVSAALTRAGVEE